MSSPTKKIVLSPAARSGIQKIQNEVFGSLPQLQVKTGYQALKKMHRGAFIARYYPDPIAKFARMGTPGYKTDQEERRLEKLEVLRRRGKGPPKKGAGKRQQKKK